MKKNLENNKFMTINTIKSAKSQIEKIKNNIYYESQNKNKLNDNEIAKKEKKEEKKNNEEVEEEIINNNKDDNENKDENEIKNYYLNNEMVKILIETYLENAPMPQTKVNKKIKNNKVSLLLGLKLPGIYIPLKDIIKYIKNEVKNKYKNIVKEKFKLASTNSETDIKNLNRRKSKLNPIVLPKFAKDDLIIHFTEQKKER